MKKIFLLLSFVLLIASSTTVLARDNVDYWYVKNFDSTITVNKDSSLDIEEDIVADCGSAQKHGIFRVLPTIQQITSSEQINSPITLTSITDFDNNDYKYSASKSLTDHTVTWKIGDADKFVTGSNNYRIKYHVKNAVRHNSAGYDELYWNLTGNFWDIPIDNFRAKVIFPDAITKDNTQLSFYSGSFSDKNSLDVSGNFSSTNTVELSYDKTLDPGEGVTLSASFPKDIIAPYVPGFMEKYGSYFYYLIPLLILWFCYKLWSKYGRDPSINPTIAPEFDAPEKLSPIDMGMVQTDGILQNQFISASIINLAVNGFLKIKKIEKSGVFSSEDYELTKSSGRGKLSASEHQLYNALFEGRDKLLMGELRNEFYTNVPKISAASSDYLIGKKWLVANSRLLQYVFIGAFVMLFVASIGSTVLNTNLFLSLLLSAIIVLIFSFLMRRRTPEGAELANKIKGFKLYMDTAEKYRQRFNEKENIFERFLPYAIMFGITGMWIQKMRDIYGEKYFATYHPIWFIGSFNSFNVDSLSSEISHMSSSMASTITSSPSSSGMGGGGFSGGGGGGGGGGGW